MTEIAQIGASVLTVLLSFAVLAAVTGRHSSLGQAIEAEKTAAKLIGWT